MQVYLAHLAAASFLYAWAVSGFTTTAQGAFSSEKEFSEKIYACFCKCVCAFFCSHLPEGDYFPVEQTDCTSAAGGERCVWLWRAGLAEKWEMREEKRREGKRKEKKPQAFEWQDCTSNMWPACTTQASGGSRSTGEREALAGQQQQEAS